MGHLLRSLLKIKGSVSKYSFNKATKNPRRTQDQELSQILKKNRATEFGRKFGFAKIGSSEEFQKNVPINTYQDLEPSIEKMMRGGKNILTNETPIMFNVTSGTSDKPKYIPVTESTRKKTACLMQQWLYTTLLDHPSFLNSSNLSITGSAIEGYTVSGIPYGSLSGLIYKNLPTQLRRSYTLPFIVSEIKEYDLRYYIMVRLGYGSNISFAATPNPTTLIKFAEVGVQFGEEIIRSIYDGRLLLNCKSPTDSKDLKIINIINNMLKPDRRRAKFLANTAEKEGRLLPRHCWPDLKLIGCWLGGNIGLQADRLSAYFGNTPKRDLGYLASEGCMTLPFMDATSSGILSLKNNYYEFLPEEPASDSNPEVLLPHELEIGKRYGVLLTNESGLYRYNINDTVEVTGFYNRTPVLAFMRKTQDVLNITGEKIHLNQLLMAVKRLQTQFNLPIYQFRVSTNFKETRYEFFVCSGNEKPPFFFQKTFLPAVDTLLMKINIEYCQKRKSKRLNPPCIHLMHGEWEDSVKREELASGRRDIQYKWTPLSEHILDIDKKYIKTSLFRGNDND